MFDIWHSKGQDIYICYQNFPHFIFVPWAAIWLTRNFWPLMNWFCCSLYTQGTQVTPFPEWNPGFVQCPWGTLCLHRYWPGICSIGTDECKWKGVYWWPNILLSQAHSGCTGYKSTSWEAACSNLSVSMGGQLSSPQTSTSMEGTQNCQPGCPCSRK